MLAQIECPKKVIFPFFHENEGVVKVKGRLVPSNQSKLTDL
jgi:hypothetical protein